MPGQEKAFLVRLSLEGLTENGNIDGDWELLSLKP